MSTDTDETSKSSSRRQFLKGSLVAGVAGVASATGVATVAGGAAAADAPPAAPATGKPSWETPPAPIADSQIVKTVEADLVIVGAGCAGLFAAHAAAEQGGKVVVIEKMKTFSARGNHNGAINTKLHKKDNIHIDPDQIVAELVQFAGNRVHPQLLKMWAEKSGEVLDHYIEIGEQNGLEASYLDTFNPSPKYPHLYPGYPTPHILAKKGGERSKGNEYVPTQIYFYEVVEKSAKAKGVQFDYSTSAQQLVKGADGRISGVIAKSKEGFVKYTAKKAVILAAGGYGENKEMVSAWCPVANDPEIKTYTPLNGNTGDGFLMALWSGAALQKWPHPAIIHTIPGISIDLMAGNQSFMHVNRLGVRYENEALPNQTMCDGRFRQPGNKAWAIFDSKYEKDHETFKTGFDGPLNEPMAELEKSVQKGTAIKANTIEDLGKAIGVPVDTFKQTVARYTEFARKGKDEDFNKDAWMMFTIEKAPFFAVPIKSHLLVTVGGLDCDPDMQVLDKSGNKIPGLYAVGNMMGNFFANEYPLLVLGLSHGRALVLSHLLGQKLAKA